MNYNSLVEVMSLDYERLHVYVNRECHISQTAKKPAKFPILQSVKQNTVTDIQGTRGDPKG